MDLYVVSGSSSRQCSKYETADRATDDIDIKCLNTYTQRRLYDDNIKRESFATIKRIR